MSSGQRAKPRERMSSVISGRAWGYQSFDPLLPPITIYINNQNFRNQFCLIVRLHSLLKEAYPSTPSRNDVGPKSVARHDSPPELYPRRINQDGLPSNRIHILVLQSTKGMRTETKTHNNCVGRLTWRGRRICAIDYLGNMLDGSAPKNAASGGKFLQ